MKLMKVKDKLGNDGVVLISDSEPIRLIVKIEDNDLCFSITNGAFLCNDSEDDYRKLDISNQNTEIYKTIDELYESIISTKEEKKELVDNDNNVVLVDETEKNIKIGDRLVIFKYPNEDKYCMLFIRKNDYNQKIKEVKGKHNRSINVRIHINKSRYKNGVQNFIEMFKKLQNIDEKNTLTYRKRKEEK